jgi:hypothetical protein
MFRNFCGAGKLYLREDVGETFERATHMIDEVFKYMAATEDVSLKEYFMGVDYDALRFPDQITILVSPDVSAPTALKQHANNIADIDRSIAVVFMLDLSEFELLA